MTPALAGRVDSGVRALREKRRGKARRCGADVFGQADQAGFPSAVKTWLWAPETERSRPVDGNAARTMSVHEYSRR